jgi:hypothetical protein
MMIPDFGSKFDGTQARNKRATQAAAASWWAAAAAASFSWGLNARWLFDVDKRSNCVVAFC